MDQRKKTYRQKIIEAREKISGKNRKTAQESIATTTVKLLMGFHNRQCVGVYLPIKGEVDPVAIVEHLRTSSHVVALPRIDPTKKILHFHVWNEHDVLMDDLWDIKAPSSSAPSTLPQILLVPMVAFDRTGMRLGYGKGFYDRTIAQYRKYDTVVTIGLAFALQEIDAVPYHDQDQPMDYIITENEMITIKPR